MSKKENVIGSKEYKAHLTVILLTADGESFEQDITLIVPGESKAQVEERLRGMQASVMPDRATDSGRRPFKRVL